MSRKIICPVDFSPSSLNAVEYAARLARKIGAEITFLHVQPIYLSEGLDLFSGTEIVSVREGKEAERFLQDTCAEVNRTFGVTAAFRVVTSLGAFEKIVTTASGGYDLIATGTNGADSAFQFYFGSHSFRLARKAKVPVLIVPEQTAYAEPGRVLFASDFRKGGTLQADQLVSFLDATGAEVLAVHVCREEGAEALEHFEKFHEATLFLRERQPKTAYERIMGADALDQLYRYLRESDSQVLAMGMQHHGLLHETAHTALVKAVAGDALCPLFVFHA